MTDNDHILLNENHVILTPSELTDIKDDVKFKTMMAINVKTLLKRSDTHSKSIDELKESINKLPCKAHDEKIKSIKIAVASLWAFFVGIVYLIIRGK